MARGCAGPKTRIWRAHERGPRQLCRREEAPDIPRLARGGRDPEACSPLYAVDYRECVLSRLRHGRASLVPFLDDAGPCSRSGSHHWRRVGQRARPRKSVHLSECQCAYGSHAGNQAVDIRRVAGHINGFTVHSRTSAGKRLPVRNALQQRVPRKPHSPGSRDRVRRLIDPVVRTKPVGQSLA